MGWVEGGNDRREKGTKEEKCSTPPVQKAIIRDLDCRVRGGGSNGGATEEEAKESDPKMERKKTQNPSFPYSLNPESFQTACLKHK